MTPDEAGIGHTPTSVGEVDPVDHHHEDVEIGQVTERTRAVAVASLNRRDTCDFDIE